MGEVVGVSVTSKFGTNTCLPAQKVGLGVNGLGGEYADYDIDKFGKELVEKSEQADSESVSIMLENCTNCSSKNLKRFLN
jgi:hypothetical protein